jgi:class 3 adenylate cyclase/tetratricopeptide (TPR) repeat protein
VTVLFADLKGSMELLADRDPEEARKLLDPVLEHMMEAIHRYEGTVNQVMGDGIMALFGAPLAHEDHAVRACYAALRMQESVKRYAEGVRRVEGVPIRIRVGLNSGEVVVRSVGSDLRMDYTAVGQTTHLAARMEQLAEPGTTLFTPATLALCEDFIQVKSLGPMRVKGLAEPLEAYELTGANPMRSRFHVHAARGLTKFVGRTSEMAQLGEALELARTGRGQVVAVVGEPGVGKSRLFWEFAHSQRTAGCLVLEAASVSYGKATTYFPVIELLRGYFQIEPRDDVRKIREKVTGKLLSLDRALETALPALLALLDVPVEDDQWARLDPPQRRQRTLDAVKHLLLRESHVQPLVVVFEDLHWIDGETQNVLEKLIDSLPTAPMLMLVNYRPEYQHPWGSKTYYRQLRLDALPTASAEELLEALLGSDPSLASLKQLLIERTEGNPFFLEESVRTVVETKALTGEAGAYRLMRAPESLQIPPTAQAILAARIDRLLPDDKRLLQAAAVVGKDVPFALLQAIADDPAGSIYESLARLQAAEFPYETQLFPEVEYTFKHALTHEIAYGSLLREQRRALHARILEAIETLHPDRLTEQIERLAHHALRGEIWEKALHYCRQAGVKSSDRRAFREAATGYEQALEALGHLRESLDTEQSAVDLRNGLAGALNLLGEYQRALVVLGEAETLVRRLDYRARLGHVLSLMSYARRLLGDLEGAIAAARQGLEITTELGDPVEQANASYSLATAYQDVGDLGRAVDLLRHNVEMSALRTPGRPRNIAIQSQARLARVLGERGEFREGLQLGEEALGLSIAEGSGMSPLVAHGSLGVLYLNKGDWEAAIRVLEAGLALGRASDNRDWSENIAELLGLAYGQTGRFAESIALLQEMLNVALQRHALYLQTRRHTYLSTVCLLAGRLEEARQHARQARDLVRQTKQRGVEARAFFALGEVHTHTSPPAVQQAETTYRKALTLAAELGMRPLVAQCHLGFGKLYRRTGQREQAHEHLTTATTMYREMGMTNWLEKAEIEMKEFG